MIFFATSIVFKGSGGTFGVPLITRICHQFESFVSAARGRFDPLAVSHALSYVDLLCRVAEAPVGDSVFAMAIEQDLEQLRISSMPLCMSALLVESSSATRKFCQGVLDPLSVRLVSQDRGLSALRESGSRNKDIPVILISSNSTPAPAYLNINTTIKRDEEFVSNLARCAGDVLAGCSN